MKPGHITLPANSRNNHRQASVGILKIEEDHDASVGFGIAVDKPMLAQIGDERAFQFDGPSERFRNDLAQHGDQMWHLFAIGCFDELSVTGEFLEEIIDGLLVVGWMQHPLAENAEMMRKIS